jgi:hypothetical protein
MVRAAPMRSPSASARFAMALVAVATLATTLAASWFGPAARLTNATPPAGANDEAQLLSLLAVAGALALATPGPVTTTVAPVRTPLPVQTESFGCPTVSAPDGAF